MAERKPTCRASVRLRQKRLENQPFRFLDLSAEVRNMIYNYLLPSSPITVAMGWYSFRHDAGPYGNNIADVRYNRQRYNPSVLYVCRQIYSEFSHLLYKYASVNVDFPYDNIAALDIERDKLRTREEDAAMTKTESQHKANLLRKPYEKEVYAYDTKIQHYGEERKRFQHTSAALQRFRHIRVHFENTWVFRDAFQDRLVDDMVQAHRGKKVFLTIRAALDDGSYLQRAHQLINGLAEVAECCNVTWIRGRYNAYNMAWGDRRENPLFL